MTAEWQRDGLATLPFFLLMAAVFTVYVRYGIVLPLLLFLLERLLGNTARFSVTWDTGTIAAIYMFALVVGAPLRGLGSHRACGLPRIGPVVTAVNIGRYHSNSLDSRRVRSA